MLKSDKLSVKEDRNNKKDRKGTGQDRKDRKDGFPVAQMVEHGTSNAKIMGSIPRESKS